MRTPAPLPLLLLMLGGCANASSQGASDPEPFSWPAGVYDLQGSVSYRDDNQQTTRTLRTAVRADLEVDGDGSVRLLTPAGVCRDLRPLEAARDQPGRRMTFICGEESYVLRPYAGSIRGQVAVRVQEAIRGRRICTRTAVVNGQNTCVAYSYEMNYPRTTKRTELRVIRRAGPGMG